jgi:hypothetical protein
MEPHLRSLDKLPSIAKFERKAEKLEIQARESRLKAHARMRLRRKYFSREVSNPPPVARLGRVTLKSP